jgi:tRNA threonylcarbamoyladenosine modification (KEOPS) complex  Pcc1 subunit
MPSSRPLLVDAEAEIEVSLAEEQAEPLYQALVPEVKDTPEGFVRAELHGQPGAVKISLRGSQLSHLKASLNAYLRLIKVGLEALQVKGQR